MLKREHTIQTPMLAYKCICKSESLSLVVKSENGKRRQKNDSYLSITSIITSVVDIQISVPVVIFSAAAIFVACVTNNF